MKILITHVYSRENKGDSVILNVLIKELKSNFIHPEIIIATMEKLKEKDKFENVSMTNSIIYFFYFYLKKGNNKVTKAINALYLLLIPLIYVIVFRITNKKLDIILTKSIKKTIYYYLNSNIIIPVGGGYLRGKDCLIDNINLIYLLQSLLIGVILKKPTILHSQSIGPFGNKFQEFVTKVVLNRIQGIILREKKSYDILRNIGVRKGLIYISTDAAFLFSPNKKNIKENFLNIKGRQGKLIIGITVRSWLNPQKQELYEKEMAKFIDYLTLNKSHHVILIPQVTTKLYNDDDRIIANRIADRAKCKNMLTVLNGEYSHHEIKRIYSKLNYLIGTRFHSVILSLTSFVPAIAIEYEHKTSGIMKDLHLSNWVIKIEDVRAKLLIKKFIKLKKQKNDYLRILKMSLPLQVIKARKAIVYIKNKYHKHISID